MWERTFEYHNGEHDDRRSSGTNVDYIRMYCAVEKILVSRH